MELLEKVFKLTEHKTTVKTEVVAGLTTFLTMAYIIFVNPAILSFASVPALQSVGVPFGPTLAATCLVAAVMTAAMGLVSNYPLAVASGMGLNAVVAFQLIAQDKLPWPAAMGIICLEGLAITILVLTGIREAMLNAIPLSQKRAISVGIGLFILFIGLVSAGIVKPGPAGVPVTLGDLSSAPVAVALFGLLLTLWLTARRSSGALLVGILASFAFINPIVNFILTPTWTVLPSGTVASHALILASTGAAQLALMLAGTL